MIKQLTYLGFVSFLLAVTLTYAWFLLSHNYYPTDFVSFFADTKILINEPERLYDFDTQREYQMQLASSTTQPIPLIPFANPPTFLLLFLPVSNLSPATAYKLLMALNLGLLMVAIKWLTQLFPPKTKLRLIFILALIGSFAPVYTTIIQIQSSVLTLLIFISVYTCLRRQHWWLAGLISSTLIYKPQLGIVLWLYLLLSRNPRVIFGLLIGGLSWLIFSWLIAGNWINPWLQALTAFPTYANTSPILLVSWVGFWHQLQTWWPALPVSILSWLFSLITLIISIMILKTISLKSHLLPQAFSLIILTTLLSVFHVHYQEVTLLVWILFTAQPLLHQGKVQLMIGAGWLIYLLAIFPPWYPRSLPLFPTFYLFLLWVHYSTSKEHSEKSQNTSHKGY